MDLSDIITKLDKLSIWVHTRSNNNTDETKTDGIEFELENVINSIYNLNITTEIKINLFERVEIVLYNIYWKKQQCGIEEKIINNPYWIE